MIFNRFFKSNYYGWIIILISFSNIMVFYGVWYSYSVLMVEISNEFDWNRTLSSSIFSVFMIVIGITGPLVGYALDRLGPKKLLSAAVVLSSLGLYICSYSQSIILFYLFFSIIFGIGGGALGLAGNSRAVEAWFQYKRGLAAGIITSGMGLGMMIFIPLIQWVVVIDGWRGGFRLLALIVLVLLFPLNCFLQRNPPCNTSDVIQKSNSSTKLHLIIKYVTSSQFLSIFWIFFTSGFVVQAVLIHQVALAEDVGFDKLRASRAFGAMGFLSTISRILWGILFDLFGKSKAYIIASLFVIFGIFFCILTEYFSSYFFLCCYVVLFAIGYSALAPLNWAIAADFFSGKNFGLIYGMLWMGTGLGAAIGPALSGMLVDTLSTYSVVLIVAALLMISSNYTLLKMSFKNNHLHRFSK